MLHTLIAKVDAEEKKELPRHSNLHLQVKPNNVKRISSCQFKAGYHP